MTSIPNLPPSGTDDAGFAMLPTWLLRDRSISQNAKVMYAILTTYAREEGVCFPSQQTIADQMGCSTDTVQRALAELRESRLVEVEVEKHATGRRNRYHLLVDRKGGVTAKTTPPITARMRREVDTDEVDTTGHTNNKNTVEEERHFSQKQPRSGGRDKADKETYVTRAREGSLLSPESRARYDAVMANSLTAADIMAMGDQA